MHAHNIIMSAIAAYIIVIFHICLFEFILSAAVGFSSREYTVTESDEFVQLLLFKKGQLRREVELQYVTQPVHQSQGMSNTCSF